MERRLFWWNVHDSSVPLVTWKMLFRAWRLRGISQRQWPPAPYRTLPAQSHPPARWCGQSWEGKAGNQSIQDISRSSNNGKSFRQTTWETLTYTGPSGSRPSNRFLTNRSLGVKSWIRWIRTMRSPTTCITGTKGAQFLNNSMGDFQDKKKKNSISYY